MWAEESGNHWTDFFDKVPPPLVVHWVKLGRLSPWVLYALESAQERLLSRLSAEQLCLVTQKYAPYARWTVKIATHQAAVKQVREIFAKAGL